VGARMRARLLRIGLASVRRHVRTMTCDRRALLRVRRGGRRRRASRGVPYCRGSAFGGRVVAARGERSWGGRGPSPPPPRSPAPTKNRSTKKRERRGALPRTKLGGPDGRRRNLVTRLVLEAVVRVQLGAVGRILEVRPVILVESRRVLEALLVHVQDESLVL